MTNIPYHTPLETAALRKLGIPEPWSFGVADRTRFGELDALGHINNAAYLGWLENFRIQYLRAYDISDLSAAAPKLVLRQVQVDYLQEMLLNEDYIVTGRTAALRRTSFRMDYAIWAGGTLRATSHAIIVMLNHNGTKQEINQNLRDTLMTRDGAVEEAS